MEMDGNGKIGKIERSGLKWRNPKPRGRVLRAYCVEGFKSGGFSLGAP